MWRRELAFKDGIRNALKRNDYFSKQSQGPYRFLVSFFLSFPEFSRLNTYLLPCLAYELSIIFQKEFKQNALK